MNSDALRQRVEEIGDTALDFDTDAERERYIEAVCETDLALKALVLEYIHGGDSLAIDPVIPEPGPVPYENRQIGPWRLVRRIGEGGFGVVYLAERNDGQVRQIGAIKFLKGTVHDRDLELRFLDERQILANLNHPGIVRLIDAGLSRDGQPYLVMEYVEDALPIDVYCVRNCLSVQDCLLLFQKVCDAVAYAHGKLVVHRDLKPANILIRPDGTPRLLDFGVAKILDPIHRAGTEAPASTNVLVGTERYFSPEQARREPVDAATDIYSLGVILYELLVGTDPYDFQKRVRESVDRIICTVDPELPSKAVSRSSTGGAAVAGIATPDVAGLAQRGRELAGDLDAILLQALHKERNRRYSGVAAFSDDIARHLTHRPVQARRITFPYLAGRYLRRHRERVLGAAIVLILAVAAFSAFFVQHSKTVANDRAAMARDLATSAADFLPKDPQRALQLAIYAVEATFLHGEPAVAAAETVLHEALWMARASSTLPSAGDGLPTIDRHGRNVVIIDGAVINVWDVDAGKRVFEVAGTDKYTAARLSGDEDLLAAGDTSQKLQVWGRPSGHVVATFTCNMGKISSVAFSPDEKLIAAVGARQVQVWDLQGRRKLFELYLNDQGSFAAVDTSLIPRDPAFWTDEMSHIAVRWDETIGQGRKLLAGSPAGSGEEWDVDSGQRVLLLDPSVLSLGDSVPRVVFGPTVDRIATIEHDRVIVWQSVDAAAAADKPPENARVWTAVSGQHFTEWRSAGASGEIVEAAIDENGRHLLAATDSEATVFDLHAHGDLRILRAPIRRAALSTDGTRLANVNPDNTLTVWDVKPQQEMLVTPGSGLAWSPDGTRFATYDAGEIGMWEISPLKLFRTGRSRYEPPVSEVTFSLDGKHLAEASAGEVTAWDTVSGQFLWTITLGGTVFTTIDDGSQFTGIAFLRDGKSFGIARSRDFQVWEAGANRQVVRVDLSQGSAKAPALECAPFAAFDSTSDRVVTGTQGALTVRNAANGRVILTVPADPSAEYCSASLNPDGRLATGDRNGTTTIWNNAGREITRLNLKTVRITSVALSPDGKRVATGGDDGVVTLWNIATGEQLLAIGNHAGRDRPSIEWRPLDGAFGQPPLDFASAGAEAISRLAFSPDGKRLAVTTSRHEIRLYVLDTAELLKLARQRLARPRVLTAQDCQKYLHAVTCPAL